MFSGCRDVHIIQAGTGAPDDAQFLPRFEQPAINLRLIADQQCTEVGETRTQGSWISPKIGCENNGEATSKAFYCATAYIFGDQYVGHR